MGEGVDSRGGGQGSRWGQQWAGAPYAEPRSLTAQDSREPGGCQPREDELGRKRTHLGLSLRAWSVAGANQQSRN